MIKEFNYGKDIKNINSEITNIKELINNSKLENDEKLQKIQERLNVLEKVNFIEDVEKISNMVNGMEKQNQAVLEIVTFHHFLICYYLLIP